MATAVAELKSLVEQLNGGLNGAVPLVDAKVCPPIHPSSTHNEPFVSNWLRCPGGRQQHPREGHDAWRFLSSSLALDPSWGLSKAR